MSDYEDADDYVCISDLHGFPISGKNEKSKPNVNTAKRATKYDIVSTHDMTENNLNTTILLRTNNDKTNDDILEYITEYINLKLPITDDTLMLMFNNEETYDKYTYDKNTYGKKNNVLNERINLLLYGAKRLKVNTITQFYETYVCRGGNNIKLVNMIINNGLDINIHFDVILNFLNDRYEINFFERSSIFKSRNVMYKLNKTVISIICEFLNVIKVIDANNIEYFDRLVDVITSYIHHGNSTGITQVRKKQIMTDSRNLLNIILGFGYQISQGRFKILCEYEMELEINNQTNIILNDEIYKICSGRAFYPKYKFQNVNEEMQGLKRLFSMKTTKLSVIQNYIKKHNVVPDNICLESAVMNRLPMTIINFIMTFNCIPTERTVEYCNGEYTDVLKHSVRLLKKQVGIND